MVQMPLCDRIRREVHLEAPVKEEPVSLVRPHATTDAVGRLEDGDLHVMLSEYLCTGEAGQPGPDNDSFHTRESVTHNSEETVIPLTKRDSTYGCYRNPAAPCFRRLV